MNTVTINDSVKIELKKFKFFASGSQETNCFTSEVYADGKLIAYANNDGHGGCTYIHPAPGAQKKCADLEVYLHSQPDLVWKGFDGDDLTVECNLENIVDDLVDKAVNQLQVDKFNRTAKKLMDKKLVVGIPSQEYSTFGFNIPVSQIITSEKGRTFLSDTLLKMAKDGKLNNTDKQLLNTNLPKEVTEAVNAYLKTI